MLGMKYLYNEHMNRPTESQITALHKKYAPSQQIFEYVYLHSQIVARICRDVAQRSGVVVNTELVQAGAMLHDIGTYQLYDTDGTEHADYIRHGVIGYEILKSEGFDEAICRFAAHHTGAGISKQQIIDNKLPIPAKDYFAKTDEELLVMYADKFHSKMDTLVFNSTDWYRAYIAKFGDADLERFEAMIEKFGVVDVVGLAGEYGQGVRRT